ncbi:MAG: HEAT repeat domain-containing protein [Candidatus Aminicenantes bacterium]|nr:MAG: HEAT repeat domain-containing protein [Candidatus Aminicenantes bacterium]
MRCEDIKKNFPDYLVKDLDQSSSDDIQSHIADCASCRQELEDMSAVWTKLGVLPEEHPSNGLRERFYGMLEEYKTEVNRERPLHHLKQFFSSLFYRSRSGRPAFQIAFGFIPLLVGLSLGYILFSGSQSAELRREVQDMRQMLAVSLLDQRSTTERLRGVNLSYGLENPDSRTIEALLDTLNNDPNINVRLAAVDAMYLFYDSPSVREGIIQSLSQQESPFLQAALVDLLVSVRERQALESFKKLIAANELDPKVRQKLEQGIKELSY